MPERIGWGVLGHSTIARVCMIPAISASDNGRLRALGTRSGGGAPPAMAAALAQAPSASPQFERVYGHYEEVLEDPQVDAVYVSLPNHLHHPWTLRALAAGKHVLCEKPLACSAEQAREMAAAATASGRLLMEALMYRFHPRSRAIKALVDAGALGVPKGVRAAFTFPMTGEALEAGDGTRLSPEMGGGALLDVGCYTVSVARWLLGAEPVSVQAQAVYRHGVDVHIAGTLRFPMGALAGIEAGFVSALQQTFSVTGTEGAVELPHDAFIPWEREALYTQRERDSEAGEVQRVAGADEYRLMVEHFARAVQGVGGVDVLPEDSIRNMVALDALALAAREERTVHSTYPTG
jgi:D-xylose 1-dehydrogenase (NADP+, D-xylono-1,5-lactone-forming)